MPDTINTWEWKIVNIEEIKKSIVTILPEKTLISYNKNPKWIFKNYEENWIWTGFFISKDWKIITANHIINNKNTPYTVITHDKKQYKAKIIYQDEEKDIAILKIDQRNTMPLSIQKKQIKVWKTTISFWTNPETLEIIYNYGHIIDINKKLDNMSNLIQISNPLSPWFSGGPTINSTWEVIWINYAIYQEENVTLPFYQILPQPHEQYY